MQVAVWWCLPDSFGGIGKGGTERNHALIHGKKCMGGLIKNASSEKTSLSSMLVFWYQRKILTFFRMFYFKDHSVP